MKMPEWLPDAYHPKRIDQEPNPPLVDRLVKPINRFMQIEAAGGIALLVCTAIALAVANSPRAAEFAEFWQTQIGFSIGDFTLKKSISFWVNDGLMTIFFFLAGLEIKREMVFGELRDPRKLALPAAAALGGMVVPAGIYLALQWHQPGMRGWGIPMATDIAFVVGFLAILGKRVPFSLKILLLTLAIVDDIGAILVIAVAYTSGFSLAYLALAAVLFGLIYLFNRIGIRQIPIYIILGAGIWLAFLKCGIHPTVAGVILGLLTPATPWFSERSLLNAADGVVQRLRRDQEGGDAMDHYEEATHLLRTTARETVSPLDRLETALHPWIAFGVMPIFALANAGVAIDLSTLSNPITLAVAAGLVLGKPIGIVGFSYAVVKVGLCQLPTDVGWGGLLGAACLAGIGFTMSIFVAGLAFHGDLLLAGKSGTLVGSALSAVLGAGLLLVFLPDPSRASRS